MYIVGLTGGIGSGKSTVSRFFRELGINVVDADIAARAIMEPGLPALAAVAEHFGAELLRPDGTLDRAQLRRIVFADPEQRRWLEQVTHPLIAEWIREQLLASPPPYAILETPLLFESQQKKHVQRKLVVDVPEEVQLARTMRRDGNTEEQVRAIMAAQMPRRERLASADDVIDNTGSLEDVRRQVQKLHELYVVLAAQHRDSRQAAAQSRCDQQRDDSANPAS